jgi:hypothetical protein
VDVGSSASVSELHDASMFTLTLKMEEACISKIFATLSHIHTAYATKSWLKSMLTIAEELKSVIKTGLINNTNIT